MNYIGRYQEKIQKVDWVMKDEVAGKIIRKFVSLGAKTYCHLVDEGREDKKAKPTKKCVIKEKLKSKIIKTV